MSLLRSHSSLQLILHPFTQLCAVKFPNYTANEEGKEKWPLPQPNSALLFSHIPLLGRSWYLQTGICLQEGGNSYSGQNYEQRSDLLVLFVLQTNYSLHPGVKEWKGKSRYCNTNILTKDPWHRKPCALFDWEWLHSCTCNSRLCLEIQITACMLRKHRVKRYDLPLQNTAPVPSLL